MDNNPRIDFYVLKEPSPNGRLTLTCRIVSKAYKLGHKIFVRTEQHEDATELDQLLWTFSQNSFIPHQLAKDKYSENFPVVIGQKTPIDWGIDVVISMADQPICDFLMFGRISEIVGYEKAEKESGRARFRYYRDHGVAPYTHQIAL